MKFLGTIVAVWVMAALAPLIGAQSKSQMRVQEKQAAAADNDALSAALRNRFSLTPVNGQTGAVNAPGTVYVVAKGGIRALPMHGTSNYWPNYYFKNGHVHQPYVKASSSSSNGTSNFTIGIRMPGLPDGTRHLQTNESVYITQIAVNGRIVSFLLQSCSDASRAEMDFHFASRNLAAVDLREVLETISQLLVDPNAKTEQAEESTGSAGQSDDLASTMIRPGMSLEEVKSMLGEPEKIKRDHEGAVLMYTGFEVRFAGNAVSSIAAR